MNPSHKAMTIGLGAALSASALLLSTQPVQAQTAPSPVAVQAAAQTYPPVFRVRKHEGGFYYVTTRGSALYALNRRVAFTRSGGAEPYCVDACAKLWKEVSAPADAKAFGDWSLVDGVAGLQWAYRGNPVFTYAADRSPGDTRGDGYDDLWTLIAHVPPPPAVTTPPGVSPLFAHGRYVLADSERHTLFVVDPKRTCPADCQDWTPLLAGLAARDIGEWRVDRDRARARWTYRGQPVFVSAGDEPAAVPDGGQPLSP